MGQELDNKVSERLSGIFHRVGFDVVLVLCGITDAEQLDAANGWLLENHSEEALEDDFIAWMKEGISKWGKNLKEQFPAGFAEKFPLVAKKLEYSDGNKLIYLRMAEFCGADVEFLAEQVEPIIRAREVEGRMVYKIHVPKRRPMETHPCNARCFVLNSLACYTQTAPWTFRDTFLPNLGCSGGGSNDMVRFDWRPQEDREKEEDSV